MLVVDGPAGADDVAGVVRVVVPEGRLGDLVGLIDDLVAEAEGLEGLHAARLDAVCLAEDEAVGALVDEDGVDVVVDGEGGGRHHAGRPGANDENVDVLRHVRVWRLRGLPALESDPGRGFAARVGGNVTVVMEFHLSNLSLRCETRGEAPVSYVADANERSSEASLCWRA